MVGKKNSVEQSKKRLTEKCQHRTSNDKFEIIDIDSVQTIYVIYAKKRDSTFKIVSQKVNSNNCKSIIKGGFYDFKIKSLLENIPGKRHIGGIKYGGVLIKLEGKQIIWDLFDSENLKGLCFIP